MKTCRKEGCLCPEQRQLHRSGEWGSQSPSWMRCRRLYVPGIREHSEPAVSRLFPMPFRIHPSPYVYGCMLPCPGTDLRPAGRSARYRIRPSLCLPEFPISKRKRWTKQGRKTDLVRAGNSTVHMPKNNLLHTFLLPVILRGDKRFIPVYCSAGFFCQFICYIPHLFKVHGVFFLCAPPLLLRQDL